RILEKFNKKLTRFIDGQLADFQPELQIWNERLKQEGFACDPCLRDWSTFRPLRLSREEEWSDWIAHLIETSTTGIFCHSLLNLPDVRVQDFVKPAVERESYVEDKSRRTDVIIELASKYILHLEIKLKLTGLDKCDDTAKKIDKRFDGSDKMTRHFLLLPMGLPHSALKTTRQFEVRLWIDLAVALRQSLFSLEESIEWMAWAIAFLGCVEQKLCHARGTDAKSMKGLPVFEKLQIATMTTILKMEKESMNNIELI